MAIIVDVEQVNNIDKKLKLLEERIEICRLACYGDYGRVSCAEGINLEFPQQLSKDQECCELLFTRKK